MTETALRLELNRRGVPRLVLNYVVPSIWYPNGAPITFDLALPEMKIAWEYQGDHHRTDKAQYRRDNGECRHTMTDKTGGRVGEVRVHKL